MMDYDAKLMMIVCFFLGSKVENRHLTLDDLVKKVPAIEASMSHILDLEITLAKTLAFHFDHAYPATALYGIFLDAQVSVSALLFVSLK
jgi:Cyclin, N-terminal domain